MKIPVKVYAAGGIDCLEDSCPFKGECANHETAGDFRSEDGFTPELSVVDGQWSCKTYDREPHSGEYLENFPENTNKLPQGNLVLREGKLMRYVDIYKDDPYVEYKDE